MSEYKVDLVFDEWRDAETHESLRGTERGTKLTMSDFHTGTMFRARLVLDDLQKAELQRGLDANAYPVFYLSLRTDLDDETSR